MRVGQPHKLDRETARRAVDRLFVQFRLERGGKRIARFALRILRPRAKVSPAPGGLKANGR